MLTFPDGAVLGQGCIGVSGDLSLHGIRLVRPDPGWASGRLARGEIAIGAVLSHVAADGAGADRKEVGGLQLRHATLDRADNPDA
jgi:hypothetical protein